MNLFSRLCLVLALFSGVALRGADEAAPKFGCDIISAYIPVQKALAADDLAKAQAAAAALAKQAVSNGLTGVVEKAQAVADAKGMVAARNAFKVLSEEVEPLSVTEKNATVMYCPMAKASWVQASGPVENPYYGKSMLRCGGPKGQ